VTKGASVGTRILIIESDPERASFVRRAIGGEGAAKLNLEFTETLATSLRMLKENYRAVLLNLNLADSHGIGTLRKVRAHFEGKQIFVMSESTDVAMTRMILEFGPAKIVGRKALSPELLLDELSKTRVPQCAGGDGKMLSRVVPSFFNATTDAAVIVDDGIIQLTNGRFRSLVHLRPEEPCTGVALSEFIHPEDLLKLEDGTRYDEAELREQNCACVRVALGNGNWQTTDVWMVRSGDWKDQRSIVVFRAPRNQKNFELGLRHLSSVLDMMSDGIVAMALDGVILSWNEGAERIYGHAATDAMGQNVRMLLSPGRSLEMETVLQRTRKGEETIRFATVGVRNDGNTFPCSLAVLPSFDDDGNVIEATIIVRETRDQWRLDAQFRQAQKMEAIGQLAGGIAHDFNNLLGVISGYTELLEVQLDHQDPAIETSEKIRRTAHRAAGLVAQLLAFSRQQVLEPKIISLSDIVSDTAEIVRRMVGQDIEIVTILAAELWTVQADEVQLQQVIMNLAVNARDAMPNGGLLRFETDNVNVDSDYAEKNPPILPGQYVRLRATDNGTGIDPKTKSRIFEPFFTTKERGKGTGLGLATVYGIVKQSGGYIWVNSAIGAGTAFSIFLPRVGSAKDLAGRRTKANLDPEKQQSNETILLLEDDPSMLEIISRFLEDEGYKVLPTGSAAEALRIAAEHEGFIDLFLTDIVMPGMSGPVAAERLLQTRPGTRILFVSGHSTDKIPGRHAYHRSRIFVQKPFTRKRLMEKVREVLDSGSREIRDITGRVSREGSLV
jgi:PAS domain S-box-containing protein